MPWRLPLWWLPPAKSRTSWHARALEKRR